MCNKCRQNRVKGERKETAEEVCKAYKNEQEVLQLISDSNIANN